MAHPARSSLLSIGHSWSRRPDHFHNCSCPPPTTPCTQAFPHMDPQAHAQTGSTGEICLLVFLLFQVFFISSVPHCLQPTSRCLTSILGKSNLQFAGMTISLTISTSSLNLLASDCKQVRLKSAVCILPRMVDLSLMDKSKLHQ